MNEESGVTQFTDILSDEEFDKLEELLYRPKWGYTHKSTADDRWRRWRMELKDDEFFTCLLYTSPSPRDRTRSRMPSSA